MPARSQTESTGTKIGKVVSDAISTAFPITKGILDQLFPRNEKSKTVSQDDLKKAVETERNAAQKRAIDALQPLKEAQSQLKLVTDAARHAVTADVAIAQMQATIVATRNTSNEVPSLQWREISRNWVLAEARLNALKGTNVNSVALALREPLQRIVDLSYGSVDNMKSAVKDNDTATVLRLAGEMRQALGPMAYITGFIVADLSDGLAAVESGIKGSMSGQVASTSDFTAALSTLRAK
jgi:hypothetical protein